LNEEVMVFPKEYLSLYEGEFKGGFLRGDCKELLEMVLDPSTAGYMERSLAEVDPEYLQVIPYCVLWRGREVFAYRRTTKGGEGRLHGLRSIGVGGHINPPDGHVGGESYENALWRELHEEVGLTREGAKSNTVVGVIHDPTTDVGKVHFGVVHFIQLGANPAGMSYKDEALSQHQWVYVSDLRSLTDLETWSRIIVDNLF
jgi:predicted NUDIX family phosphoesterase